MNKLLSFAALALLQQIALAPSALAQASAAQAAGKTKPSPLAPSEIVAAAPKADWTAIAPSDLLVMDLAPDAKGKPRRVVIQLMPPPFSQGWIGNIRKLAAAHWWDGLSINRLQDNYVVQWGDANADDKVKARALPAGLVTMAEADYVTGYSPAMFSTVWGAGGRGAAREKLQPLPPRAAEWHGFADPYAGQFAFAGGFPVGLTRTLETVLNPPQPGIPRSAAPYLVPKLIWPVHCYGMVGVGRDLSPNTGTGAELYAVIGHAPRHLDRNIALVGRVIEGIEYLSSLPRGTATLGFYQTAAERTSIVSIRLGGAVPGLPAYEYLSTEGAAFGAYADARANRRDPFFIRPAGGADVCNIPVPVRRVKP